MILQLINEITATQQTRISHSVNYRHCKIEFIHAVKKVSTL